MGKIRIASDVDGVLLDQGELLCPHLGVDSIEKITVYALSHYGLSDKDIDNIFYDFEKKGKFLRMRAVPHAVENFLKLSQKGYPMNIATARNLYSEVKNHTILNLANIGILLWRDYEKIFCEPDKLKVMGENNLKLMIEDCPQNIYELSANGIYCACIAQPWNQEVKDSDLVKRLSWNEVPNWVDDVNKKFQ